MNVDKNLIRHWAMLFESDEMKRTVGESSHQDWSDNEDELEDLRSQGWSQEKEDAGWYDEPDESESAWKRFTRDYDYNQGYEGNRDIVLVKRYKGTNKDTTSIGYGFSYVIGASTFSGNNAPKEVNIDYGLRGIEKDAFEGCDNIETLNIVGKTEDEVKSMENYPWGIEDVSVIKCEP